MTPQEYNDWAKTQVTMTVPITITAVSRHRGTRAIAAVLAELAAKLPDEFTIDRWYNWNDAHIAMLSVGTIKEPIVQDAGKMDVPAEQQVE